MLVEKRFIKLIIIFLFGFYTHAGLANAYQAFEEALACVNSLTLVDEQEIIASFVNYITDDTTDQHDLKKQTITFVDVMARYNLEEALWWWAPGDTTKMTLEACKHHFVVELHAHLMNDVKQLNNSASGLDHKNQGHVAYATKKLEFVILILEKMLEKRSVKQPARKYLKKIGLVCFSSALMWYIYQLFMHKKNVDNNSTIKLRQHSITHPESLGSMDPAEMSLQQEERVVGSRGSRATWSLDGNHIIVCDGQSIRCHEVADGTVKWLHSAAADPQSIRVLSNNRFTAGTSLQVQLHDIESGVGILNQPLTGNALTVSTSENHDFDAGHFSVLWSGSNPLDYSVMVYSTVDGQPQWEQPQEISGSMIDLVWSPNRDCFIASRRAQAMMYDASNGTTLWENSIRGLACWVRWAPDANRFTLGVTDVQVYDAQTGQPQLQHALNVDHSTRWLPDSLSFITGRGMTQRYDAQTGNTLWAQPLPHHPNMLRMSPSGNHFTLHVDGGMQLCDAQTGHLVWQRPIDAFSYFVKWSPDGRYFTAGTGQWVQLYDTQTGQSLWETPLAADECNVAWSPQHNRFTVSTGDHISLYEASTGQVVWRHDYTGES